MNYEETIQFLYQATPAFEQKGGSAYKPGLERMLGMSNALGNPHRTLRTIHIGGTNGKGSVSSTLASILIEQGYRVGLFTSPHLVSFRERIRINGIPIEEKYVVHFVERAMPLIEKWQPSFFELTTLMAFDYFSFHKVDIAIIEVGMGGRLDSTNIIQPLLSVITNVSLDHTQFLGSTLVEIAREKAGIIKSSTPVVLGEKVCEDIFASVAKERLAPFYPAYLSPIFIEKNDEGGWSVQDSSFGSFKVQLQGVAQEYNTRTILTALQILRDKSIIEISDNAVKKGFAKVETNSHLLGRWQKVSTQPVVILDTGHNLGGISLNVLQLQKETFQKLHIVFGMVSDKAWQEVLRLLPLQSTFYYFATPECERGLPAEEMLKEAKKLKMEGKAYPSIIIAFREALQKASSKDLIYVGGSNYIVAEVLKKEYPHLLESSFLSNQS